MNLTSVKPGRETVIRHYCESLFFAAHLPGKDNISVLDLGSGAGFPGVPMAVLKPEWHLTLAEANKRKAVFLREATRQLVNASVLEQRFEAIHLKGDWVVSRAVDSDEVLSNVPRLAVNVGLMISEEDLMSLPSKSSIAWYDPVRLPWGDQRLCVYGAYM